MWSLQEKKTHEKRKKLIYLIMQDKNLFNKLIYILCQLFVKNAIQNSHLDLKSMDK